MKIGNKEFNINCGHTYVMGILNVTPDSFSDGGSFVEISSAMQHVEQMISEGADIIDVGGESTRPGHQQISEAEEIERVTGIISSIKSRFDIPVSIDTYKAPVAEAALGAGADLVNDIWGLRYHIFEELESVLADEQYSGSLKTSPMAEVVKKYNVPVILMHNDMLGRSLEERNDEAVCKFIRANSEQVKGELVQEKNVAERVIAELRECISVGLLAGINPGRMIIDPGIGFAKTQKENLITLNSLRHIREEVGMEYPMLLAASRKSVIGNALQLPPDEREEGTIVTTILGAEAECSFVRVHDVEKNVRAIRMYEAVRNCQNV